MTWAYIAWGGLAGTADGVTTGTFDTSGADLIVVSVAWYSGITANGVLSDSKGNTWQPLTRQWTGNTDNRLFWVANPIVGTGHTFTYAATGIYPTLSFIALSGAAASPFDQENGAAMISTQTLATGSVTPSENNEVIITGLLMDGLAAVPSINGGFGLYHAAPWVGGVNEGEAIALLEQTTATAANPTWDLGSVANILVTTIATFKAAGAAVTGGRSLVNAGLVNRGLVSAGLVN